MSDQGCHFTTGKLIRPSALIDYFHYVTPTVDWNSLFMISNEYQNLLFMT